MYCHSVFDRFIGNSVIASTILLEWWFSYSISEPLRARLQCLSEQALSVWVFAERQEEGGEPSADEEDGYNEDGCAGIVALEPAKGVD